MKKNLVLILIIFITLLFCLLIIWKIKNRTSILKPEVKITPTAISKLNRGEIIVGAAPDEYTTINSLVELFAIANSNIKTNKIIVISIGNSE